MRKTKRRSIDAPLLPYIGRSSEDPRVFGGGDMRSRFPGIIRHPQEALSMAGE